jgi:hypothetical protein
MSIQKAKKLIKKHSKVKDEVMESLYTLSDELDAEESKGQAIADAYIDMYVKYCNFLEAKRKAVDDIVESLVGLTITPSKPEADKNNMDHAYMLEVLELIEQDAANIKHMYEISVADVHKRYGQELEEDAELLYSLGLESSVKSTVNRESTIGSVKIYGDIPVRVDQE